MIIDGSGGFANGCAAILPDAKVHRCLQHVKSNVKKDANKRANTKSSKKRLNDSEFKCEIIDRMMFSSKLGFPHEFSCLSGNLISRMMDVDDWDEIEEAEYLHANVLQENGN